jgi:hypothetical protein
VARHIFQACSVWICTRSNITSIIFTWVHYTNTRKYHWQFNTNFRAHLNKVIRLQLLVCIFVLQTPAVSLCFQANNKLF